MADYNGNEGTYITLAAGGTMTDAYRKAYASQPQGYFFGKNKINGILGQTGCMGIRVYFGQDASGNLALVLVGADYHHNDQTTGYVLDNGATCPPDCGAADALNS